MKYSEWIKKYSSESTKDAMDNLFTAFKRWLDDNPQVKEQVPAEYGMQDIFRILFANGIQEN